MTCVLIGHTPAILFLRSASRSVGPVTFEVVTCVIPETRCPSCLPKQILLTRPQLKSPTFLKCSSQSRSQLLGASRVPVHALQPSNNSNVDAGSVLHRQAYQSLSLCVPSNHGSLFPCDVINAVDTLILFLSRRQQRVSHDDCLARHSMINLHTSSSSRCLLSSLTSE